MSVALSTRAGELSLEPATLADFATVMAIVREAAAWLSSRGNPQWEIWYSEIGEQIMRERVAEHEFYLGRIGDRSVATICIQWSDPMVWGARGDDGLAGYVHSIAIVRGVGGRGVGADLLEWAVRRIAERGRRFARLDCMAGNAALCAYYQARGFTPLGVATLPGDWTSRLFEREIPQSIC
ncbi:MAG TPA: GNAT family N-acetyltransferase [Candidatus Binataceae bacterium]|nr:GNAT family N-acetyltransferase [Candidatus Binataceae bacterium]